MPQLADHLAHSAWLVFTAQLQGQPPLVPVLLVLLAHTVQVVHLTAHNALQALSAQLFNSHLPCALDESLVLQVRTQWLEQRHPFFPSQVCALHAEAPSLHR